MKQITRPCSQDQRQLDVMELQKLWDDFARLRKAMLSDPGEADYLEPDDFQWKATAWANDFKRITFEEVSYAPGK